MSCQIVDKLDEILIQPLQEALGIDAYSKVRSEYRSWFGLKELIPDLVRKLERFEDENQKPGVKVLWKRVFTGVKVAVERQMSTVKFYREDGLSQEKLSKIGYTPLTNSGCESNLGDLTYGITRGAGSDTKMKTFSDKNIIRKNRLFETKKWKMMSKKERSAKWKWARNSSQAKKVRKIGKEYMELLKATKTLSLVEKEHKKNEKRKKALKLLEECKTWGGPVTEESLDKLHDLDESQLTKEVRYLRATVAPNIREKRKEGNKFVHFDKDQLIFQIRNSVKPTADCTNDVENLLNNVFDLECDEQIVVPSSDVQPEDSTDAATSAYPPGLVGQFSGPLEEIGVGVVVSVGSGIMLQLYESKRYGYVPALVELQSIEEWTLVEEICEYKYVNYPSKPGLIFLKF